MRHTQALLSILLALVLPAVAGAQMVKVNTSQPGSVFVPSGRRVFIQRPSADVPRPIPAAFCLVDSFTPGRAVNPSPGAPMRTPLPWSASFSTCPIFFGSRFDYQLAFNSPHDVGTWRIRCLAESVDAVANNCTTDLATTCQYSCDTIPGSAVVNYQEHVIQVWNDAPRGIISHSGTPEHGQTVRLSTNASDPDGGGALRYTWSVVSRPAGATATLSATNVREPTLAINGEGNFGAWVFELAVDDDENERAVLPRYTLTVTNRAPQPRITGPARINYRDALTLAIDPNDEDGGTYTSIIWEVWGPRDTGWRSLPAGTTPHQLTMTPDAHSSTTPWRFRARVRDNDPTNTDGTSPEHTVLVENRRPTVTFSSPPDRVMVGNPVVITSMASDPDGGLLTYRWELIQAPTRSGETPRASFRTEPHLNLPTATVDERMAGSWRFKLHVTDDEGETTASSAVDVLVDALPRAAIQNPGPTVGPGPFELRDASEDPDSPCPMDPNRCHAVAAGHPLSVSGDFIRHNWFVDAVPSEHAGRYPLGPVSVAFPGVVDTRPVLQLEPSNILPGIYRFRLVVEDAENHIASASLTVEVLPLATPPVANLSPPRRYFVNVPGGLTEDVVVDGRASFDFDNIRPGGSSSAGLGISHFAWSVQPPVTCPTPTVPSGAGVNMLTLFTAGATVSPGCMGVWRITLTVTDDDTPAQTGTESVELFFGNCAGDICIDDPTQARPRIVTSGGAGLSVPITYHVDPSVYGRPELQWGMYARIEVLRTGSSEAVYEAFDPTPSFALPGDILTFHWNGNRTDGTPAPAGSYDLRLSLTDVSMTPVVSDFERLALLYEPVRLTFGADSPRFARHPSLEARTELARFSYAITGSLGIDRVRYTLSSAAAGAPAAVTVEQATHATSGTVSWDGRSGTTMLPPGDYVLHLTAYSGTTQVATGEHRFTLYRLRLGPVPALPAPGLRIVANLDDDDMNNAADDTQRGLAQEDDLVPVAMSIEPATLRGTATVVPDGAAPYAVAAWDSAMKGTARTLPLDIRRPMDGVPSLWLEGLRGGASALTLRFVPEGGLPALVPERLALNIVSMEVMVDAMAPRDGVPDMPLFAVAPGLWENAYTPSFGPLGTVVGTLRTGAAWSDNFVSQNPTSFYVRVVDASANRNPSMPDTVRVMLGTLFEVPLPAGASPDYTDGPHPITLHEAGTNTGIFTSSAQMLTSNDHNILQPDDAVQTTDPILGPLPDNSDNDRTHRLGRDGKEFLRGGVQLVYTPVTGGVGPQVVLPTCRRDGEQKEVRLEVHVWEEPFQDVGYKEPGTGLMVGAGDGVFSYKDGHDGPLNGKHDPGEPSEPYKDFSGGGLTYQRGEVLPLPLSGHGGVVEDSTVEAQVARANAAWAPACIQFRQGSIIHDRAPVDAMGVPIHEDGLIREDTSFHEVRRVEDAFSANPVDVFHVIFTAPDLMIESHLANAMTSAPMLYPLSGSMVTLAIMTTGLDIQERTLAHEAGHALTNGTDVTNPGWQFYPALITDTDDAPEKYRRFPMSTLAEVRTVREPGPAHHADRGNTLLHAVP